MTLLATTVTQNPAILGVRRPEADRAVVERPGVRLSNRSLPDAALLIRDIGPARPSGV